MSDPLKKEKRKIKSAEPAGMIRRWQLAAPVVLCVIGVLLNIGGKMMATATKLPFHFDTAGTILASALGGYIPGIATALVTNLFSYRTDPTTVYYAPLTVFIAFMTAMLYSRKKLGKLWQVLLYTAGLVLICGVFGGAIAWYVQGVDIEGSDPFLIGKLNNAGFSSFTSWYIANFVFEIFDKTAVIIFVELVLFLIPEKTRKRFEMTLWMQDPMPVITDSDSESTKKVKGKVSLRTKFRAVLIVISLILAASCTVICLVLFRRYSINQHKYIAESIAKLAASVVEADDVNRYLDGEGELESYAETKELLAHILNSTEEVEYVYVYKIMSDGCHVVFDVDTEGMEGNELGDVIPFDRSFMPVVPALLAGEHIDPLISDDTYGWLLTAYEPVYDSNGECVCYAAADISMNSIVDYEVDFIFRQLCIFIGFFALFISVALWLAKFSIIYPISSMSHVTEAFEYDDEYVRRDNLRKLTQLDIGTGDEIEQLYRALVKTTDESTRYFEESKKNSEKIEAMQSGLLITLADMVENRDESTGDHVRKTAAYVGIIGRKMLELGYYKDQVTERFVSDCERSAPLHDIGKIAIPDAVLNKPGKLDEEEFAIMKTHAEEGKKVIEKVISSIPDADYLEEAKNVAGYHHEKWNGTGYPEGLSGEDIPLSARLMAVADVFDALVSRRVYKPAMPYEKAMSIIKEDAGKHFDPLVADAFIKAKEEVIAVAERFDARGTNGQQA